VQFALIKRVFPFIAIGALLVTACATDEPGGDASRFCGEIEANQAQLTSPQLATSTDVEQLLELYREIGEFAPLAIEPEWDQLILNYETASTVVPGDDASMQEAVAMALQSEQSAARVKNWLVDNCALDIGPVDTLAPQG
jgi:hypothetical protein